MPVQSVVSEKKARRAYIPYTALTLDADYRICTYGDAAYCLFGHPEAAMLGKPVSAIIPGLKKSVTASTRCAWKRSAPTATPFP